MPDYNVAAGLLAVVGVLGGLANRQKLRPWILAIIGGLVIVNLALTPHLIGKLVFGLGVAWIVWTLWSGRSARSA